MAAVPSKHSRDLPQNFDGLLNNLQDWELSLKDKDKKLRLDATGKGKPDHLGQPRRRSNTSDSTRVNGKQTADKTPSSVMKYDYLKELDALGQLSAGVPSQESFVDATSEKELGNEYFKQKKFNEAIDCYSRSIALSPSAVAYANRAMAYIRIKRFQEAENDCTEALNLDDRYIKEYSRRSIVRKEIGKLKESVEDVEFALRLEPQNQEIKKQHAEYKSLFRKETQNLKMAKGEVASLKDAVHKLQLSLLEGIEHENYLSAAGSLLSRSDYQDVVTERTIGNMCGYPLCTNSLPADRPWKGRYRISLREHKVYDVQETYMYCSSNCLISSKAFSASLQEERSSDLNLAKVNEVLKLFDGSLDSHVNMGEKGDLGLSGLKIQEKTDAKVGELTLEEWAGPSNAIDGYVPRRVQNSETKKPNNTKKSGAHKQVGNIGNAKKGGTQKQVGKFGHAEPNMAELAYEMNFTSTIITQDEYSISKTAPPVDAKERKVETDTKVVNIQGKPTQKPSENTQETKSSLKTSGSKKLARSVTWADENSDAGGRNLCEISELKDEGKSEESYRFEFAEACAKALSQAAEAVASGQSEASDAVSEVGLTIVPPPHGEDDGESEEDGDVVVTDPLQLRWPLKPGFSSDDLLDSEENWYDSPPEGFNLMLSPFSTMFMALFSWISSFSLAYIYGKEECFHEEYLSVNGREYPHKIVMPDGLSSEIKQTLAGCLSRAMPGLVAELRLPIPISTLELGLGRLLETMSFLDPLPPLRTRQWQVIDLLFLDALSVSRIPALTPYMVSTRSLLLKLLEGAQINVEEFETMKDLMIPLGRVPQFSTQNGG